LLERTFSDLLERLGKRAVKAMDAASSPPRRLSVLWTAWVSKQQVRRPPVAGPRKCAAHQTHPIINALTTLGCRGAIRLAKATPEGLMTPMLAPKQKRKSRRLAVPAGGKKRNR
jgi:hypothetical protein